MEKSTVFIPGQVWYWRDPCYGEKRDNRSIAKGDASVRYSRYILILEASHDDHVTAIPLSSEYRSDDDLFIALRFASGHDSPCYARVSHIFPASAECLTRYICTVPKSIMESVESVVVRKFCPLLCEILDPDAVKELCGIDIGYKYPILESYKAPGHQLEGAIRLFIREHIEYTGNPDDFVELSAVASLFSRFGAHRCGLGMYDYTALEFIDTFSRELGSSADPADSGHRYSIEGYRCIKLKNEDLYDKHEETAEVAVMKTDVPDANDQVYPSEVVDQQTLDIVDHHMDEKEPEEDQEEEPVVRRGGRNNGWTAEEMTDFIADYEAEMDPRDIARKYQIKSKAVNRKYRDFKRKLFGDNVSFEESEPSEPKDICEAVLEFSEVVIEYFRGKNLFTCIGGNIRVDGQPVDIRTFYDKVENIVNDSLVEIFNASQGNYLTDEVDPSIPYSRTWFFFDKINNDPRISKFTNAKGIMNAYHRYYDYDGIDVAWLNILTKKFAEGFGLDRSALSKIKRIASYFCER